MTNVEALKALYVALGGNSATVAGMSLTADVIAATATLITNGGGAKLPEVSSSDNGRVLGVADGAWAVVDIEAELPTVTADDNGDVLTVVEGAWAAAALPD